MSAGASTCCGLAVHAGHTAQQCTINATTSNCAHALPCRPSLALVVYLSPSHHPTTIPKLIQRQALCQCGTFVQPIFLSDNCVKFTCSSTKAISNSINQSLETHNQITARNVKHLFLVFECTN